ncbi:MAG: NADP-dependent malic enzyme, partial [Firmicutes bacterium]|nr:NADP-dependent malic enzyme [Bacillota bacterium]
YEWGGQIEVVSRVKVEDRMDLSLAYTPGVAEPCLEIQKDYNKSFDLTRRSNLVAVITDGTAVLGLGDIGPEAGMPVMEGKCALFKEFAGVDAFPVCIRSKDVDEIVRTIYLISGSFGGINLEDISAPRCFEIEKRLKEICDIPVFHDDQHGTAIVVTAGLINALRVVGKEWKDVTVAISGAGAAGSAVARMLLNMGAKDIFCCSSKGILNRNETYSNWVHQEIAEMTNKEGRTGGMAEALKGTDIFVGVSVKDVVTKEMVESMAEGAIVIPMANPDPEIQPDVAKAAGAAVVGTGRSDHPNQINNVLAFPGIFRGALDAKASDINEEMKVAAAKAIAGLVSDEELTADYIIVPPFDERVGETVAKAVYEAAVATGVARI